MTRVFPPPSWALAQMRLPRKNAGVRHPNAESQTRKRQPQRMHTDRTGRYEESRTMTR